MLKKQILALLKQKNAVLIAHYYVDGALQDLAQESGGIVSDSLAMARFGQRTTADILVIAGVKFMGETAKILSPEKTVLVIDKSATCSLDESCPIDKFSDFCDQHSKRTVVVYANTSAAVKARADWVVTSGSAVSVVSHLHAQKQKILWAPDKHLGHFVQTQTQADMLIWNGACVIHEAFSASALAGLKARHPEACVLVHPESPSAVIALADFVGSTTALIDAVKNRPESTFIIATDNGIFHQMHAQAPDKTLLEAPSINSTNCEACAHCQWMAANTMDKLLTTLQDNNNEIKIDNEVAKNAKNSIQKLLNFA